MFHVKQITGETIMSIQTACFFTGHRNIPSSLEQQIRENVREKIIILAKKGIIDFISGGAYGFDTICAEEVLNVKKRYPHIRLNLFLPCRSHTKLWNKRTKEHFEQLMKKADSIIKTADTDYFYGCMKLRNHSMANSALYCIAYCKRGKSGTIQTLAYAKKLGRIIVNIA